MTEMIEAGRLVLDPLTPARARAVLDGDLSGLTPGEGWPHEDTLDGLRGVTAGSHGWLVLLDGVVIGDCGTLPGSAAEGRSSHEDQRVDERGDIEIGYGLAAPYRGKGYGTEMVRGLVDWFRGRPEVRRLVAGTLRTNLPSRRVLERAGFIVEREDADEARYALPL